MGIIELPDNFKEIITQPDYVEDCINQYWDINKKQIKPWLGAYLKGSKVTYQDLESSGIEKGFSTNLINPPKGKGTFRTNLRHPLGYSALPELTPSSLGFQLWSKSALELRRTVKNSRATGCLTTAGGIIPKSGPGSIVKDHFTGTTASAVNIFDTYRKSDWNLDYTLNEWLPNRLINYITILIRQEEHQEDKVTGKKGVPRGDVFSLDEKMGGKHYAYAGIPLPLVVTDKHSIEITSTKRVQKKKLDLYENKFFEYK